jgi:hypothetical protein
MLFINVPASLYHQKKLHARAVKSIARYLLGTRNLGLTYRPSDHSIQCWADADFVGSWKKSIAMEEINTERSGSGYLITYADANRDSSEYYRG